MRSELLKAIKDYSDNSSKIRQSRFRDQQQTSESEIRAFDAITKLSNEAYISDKRENANSVDHSLPLSFFLRNTSTDIFMNYHVALMNDVIHTHDFFEIIYICKGSAGDWIDGTDIDLEEGDLCIHNPNASHKITRMDQEEDFILNILLPQDMFRRSFYEMLLQNQELNSFFNDFMLSPGGSQTFMAFHNPPPVVDTLVGLLVEEYLRGQDASRYIIESTFAVLFGQLLRGYKSDPFTHELVCFILDNLSLTSLFVTATIIVFCLPIPLAA